MEARLTQQMVEAIGAKKLAPYGVNPDYPFRYGEKTLAINLAKFTEPAIQKFVALLEPHRKKFRKIALLLNDIDAYLSALDGGGETKTARTVSMLTTLLTEYLRKVPGHRVYSRDESTGVWEAYYVEGVRYVPPNEKSNSPPSCRVDLVYETFGGKQTSGMSLGYKDLHKTMPEVLALHGFYVETKELRAQYLATKERFYSVLEQIGRQFHALGVGVPVSEGERYTRWSYRNVQLDKNGEPAQVVVDVLDESDEESEARDVTVNSAFWAGTKKVEAKDPGEDDDDEAEEEPSEEAKMDAQDEIPIHAELIVFDLRRQLRFRVHVSQLTEYVYNNALGTKLVLPEKISSLITMLLQHDSGFSDIIGKKGGGAIILCSGPPGTGKCLGKGTPVLLHNGRVVRVEDVKEADLLMGPDSKPRRVLSTTVGHGPLYEIVPVKGEPWVCNDVHILTLVHSVTNEVIDIPLDRYLALPASRKHHLKLFQPDGVEFAAATDPQRVSPYFLGVWLGDGAKTPFNRVAISKPDAEIERACRDEAARFGLHVRVQHDEGKCPTYHLTNGNIGGATNELLDSLRALMVEGFRIPPVYRFASRQVRAEVLAGLLDTDGHLSCGGYEIVQKNSTLANDIAFLARSLGFRVTQRLKTVNGEEYQRLFISGDVAKLPLRIVRKRAGARRQKKNVLRTGFSVRALGDGDYYGFTLEGDGRFLLGDFTVTHNTLTAEVYSEVMNRPLYSVQASQLGLTPEDLEKALLRVFDRARRWNAILLIDESDVYVAARGSNLEQNAIVGVFLRVLEYYNGVLFLTTNRSDLIDDAISSRCIAKIDYGVPTRDDQYRIWKILTEVAGLKMSDASIARVVDKYPVLSGRDVKNLLKLASFIVKARKLVEVTPEVIDFVKVFKPTADLKPDVMKF